MIFNLLINLVLILIGALFSFFPVVTIKDIPLIGPTAQTWLIYGVQQLNAFMNTFPYARITWNVFLFVIIPFEITLLVMKFFLGHRTPVNHN